MKKIRKCCVIVLLVVLFPANIFAQERRDKEQTYVLENPYEVNKITPLQGKKIKNVVLMIGDGMSLMHVYSAWTANRGKLPILEQGGRPLLLDRKQIIIA